MGPVPETKVIGCIFGVAIGDALGRDNVEFARETTPTLADGDPGIALFFSEETD